MYGRIPQFPLLVQTRSHDVSLNTADSAEFAILLDSKIVHLSQISSFSMRTQKYPPGISGNLECVISGGDAVDWLSFERIKCYTNAFIIQDGKILLGYKKRGFGQHKYNGFGGKVEEGETSQQAAIRELQEEAGVIAPLEHAGTLLFLSEGADFAFDIAIYRASKYTGTITETDEMRPGWFSAHLLDCQPAVDDIPSIPYEKMWDTDRHWMPLLLSGTKFTGRADFTQDGDIFTPRKWWFGVSTDA